MWQPRHLVIGAEAGVGDYLACGGVDIRTGFLMLTVQSVNEGPISQKLWLIRCGSNGVIAGLKSTIGFGNLVLL